MLETSLPGVFAVGDVRAGNVKRVASAVGEGAISVHLVHRALAELRFLAPDERARFEIHPELAGTPYYVSLGILGRPLAEPGTVGACLREIREHDSAVRPQYLTAALHHRRPEVFPLLARTTRWQFLPHVREGRLKLLAVTPPRRVPSLPDTPAVAETLPGYAVDTWLGIFMPAKVAPEVVKKVNGEIARVLAQPEVKAKLAPQGIELGTNSPDELARVIRDDYAKWGKVIQQAGIKGE